MAQFPFGGGMDVWVISSDERAKHDQQFLGLSPTPSGYITGDQGRNFFLQSGLPPPVLAQIWALADLNSDGRMDRHEFSIAMKLIMLKLQGFHLPPSLPPSLKQPPLPRLPHTPRGGSPVSRLGLSPPFPLSTVTNGAPSVIPPITEPPHTGVKPSSPRLPHGAKSGLVPLSERPSSPASPPSADWAVPQSSRLKYRQLFNSHDKLMIGHLTGAQARAVLMQSNLPQSQLATIWDLCDVDKDGRLAGEEFILAMHLIDMAMTGQPLPHTLSSDLIPPTFRKGSAAVPPISSQTRSQQPPVEDVEDEEWAEKKLPVTLEDRKRENFERGSAALEKRRQALEEQQREERERWEALEREEAERRERERAEQERRRQQELEKQREEERRREEQRRKEMEQREAAQREELFIQRRREQQRVAELRTQRNTLQNQLQALCEKRHLLEGKLKDVRFRLSAWKIEIENINQTREQRITEIIHLQQQLQGCQQWLGSLIPDKQHLNEQLRHTQLNSLQNNTLVMLQKAVELKLSSRQHLCDQLETVEHETRSKLLEIEAFNTQLKELREIHSRQQRTREQRLAPAVPPLAWMKRVSEEAERLADLHFIQQPEPGTPPAQSTLAGITQDKVRVVSFRALYPFNARSQDEISIQPGDIITVKVDLVDEDHVGAMGWLDGELKGKTGWFPANYTERLPDGDVPPELRPSTPSSSSSSSSSSSTASKPSASVASTEGFQATPTEARQAPPPIPVDSTPPPAPTSTEWADFSSAWASVEKGEPDGPDPWPSQPGLPAASRGRPLHQRSAFTRATVNAAIPSPVPGQGQRAEGVCVEALYGWRGKQGNHLSFSKGALIRLLELQDMWCFGELQGRRGWFPKSYVKLIPSSSEVAASEPSCMKKDGSSPSRCTDAEEEFVALFTYESAEPGDLSFQKGDVIAVLKREGDWWTGAVRDKTGVFPSNYVRAKDGKGQGPSGRPGVAGQKLELAQAIAPYTATGVEQLSLLPGQLVCVRKKNPEGWWEGELQTQGKKRRIGWFPANYVKLLNSHGSVATPPESTSPSLQTAKSVCQVVSLYEYSAQNDDELPFGKGQVINVLSTEDPDWWKGELNGSVGLFPANYVKVVTDMDSCQQRREGVCKPNP